MKETPQPPSLSGRKLQHLTRDRKRIHIWTYINLKIIMFFLPNGGGKALESMTGSQSPTYN